MGALRPVPTLESGPGPQRTARRNVGELPLTRPSLGGSGTYGCERFWRSALYAGLSPGDERVPCQCGFAFDLGQEQKLPESQIKSKTQELLKNFRVYLT